MDRKIYACTQCNVYWWLDHILDENTCEEKFICPRCFQPERLNPEGHFREVAYDSPTCDNI